MFWIIFFLAEVVVVVVVAYNDRVVTKINGNETAKDAVKEIINRWANGKEKQLKSVLFFYLYGTMNS